MNMDNLKEWMMSLKPGDEVAMKNYGLHIPLRIASEWRIATVTKVTKTGQIEIHGVNGKFKAQYNKALNSQAKYEIVPLTKEIEDDNEKYEIIAFIDKADMKVLSIEQLRQIEAIIHNGVE
jgi:predicted HNH restriction endonuclease